MRQINRAAVTVPAVVVHLRGSCSTMHVKFHNKITACLCLLGYFIRTTLKLQNHQVTSKTRDRHFRLCVSGVFFPAFLLPLVPSAGVKGRMFCARIPLHQTKAFSASVATAALLSYWSHHPHHHRRQHKSTQTPFGIFHPCMVSSVLLPQVSLMQFQSDRITPEPWTKSAC